MRKLVCLGFVWVLLMLPFSARAGEKEDQERKMRELQFQAAPPAQKTASGTIISIIPQYHYSNHGGLSTNLDGVDLKSDGGHASAASLIFLAARPLSEVVTLSFMYQFAYIDYSGGMLTPNLPSLSGRSEMQTTVHVVGGVADLNFQEMGRFQFSLIQAFDAYNGNETMLTNSVTADTRSVNDFKTRVTSLMAWYEKDFNLKEGLNLTPYAGWRAVYAHASNQNNFGVAWGDNEYKKDSSDWVHLASGGLKLNYQDGPLGLSVRGGLNYRVTSDDMAGYGSRAMAPNTVHLGYLTNFDRTVGSFGAGLSYAIPESCVVALSYDGYAGSNSDVHTGTLALVFPF